MLFYDGDGDCGSGAGLDPNLRWCLNAPLAFMLNTSAIWQGVSRLTFFITYSNDVDARRACMFCGDEGAALWGTYVSTWVAAMRHPHYMKVAAPQSRNPYLQFLTLSAAGWWPPRVPNPHPRCVFTAVRRQQLSVRPSAGRPQVAIHTAPAFVSPHALTRPSATGLPHRLRVSAAPSLAVVGKTPACPASPPRLFLTLRDT